MRIFYIFRINKEMEVLLKDNPYNLFKSLEDIYLLDKTSIGIGKDLLDQLIVPIDKLKYNKLIYNNNLSQMEVKYNIMIGKIKMYFFLKKA